MKLRELMSPTVVRIQEWESVSVAARTMGRYNIGALPVCGMDGRLKGMVTDRDLVTRCIAAGKDPGKTPVKDVMTKGAATVNADMDAEEAARIMGRLQVRRLPVVENQRICGMVSVADLVNAGESGREALRQISGNVSHR